MSEDFSDEQIRVELKRMVEDFRSATPKEVKDSYDEAENAEGITELQVRNLRETFEAGKAELFRRTQQMIDFIDRR